ncbi:hypothetical protein N781_15710 [Pontibacillus halophilus JSM 076056 = DSM 19796]|uniref:YwqI/YxiC family protein n=1 Tax=Pontibacillus halophilus JSM 076056 = DSM 19796 TaxID=1385510 RepID=A0A0A5GNJ5_9BACI|nr:YwqI/YxiC family protein [Pontibacillus halophilus]KGX92745.1 hypothetical protein N781_15710 [Pontibacillus halophilus JSM 076056 = DSM 19796]
MAKEIKVNYAEVESAVSTMESSGESYNATMPTDIASGNELDVVTKLNELNAMLQTVGETYKDILRKNNETVRKSVEDMRETDEHLSSSMKVVGGHR